MSDYVFEELSTPETKRNLKRLALVTAGAGVAMIALDSLRPDQNTAAVKRQEAINAIYETISNPAAEQPYISRELGHPTTRPEKPAR